MVHHQDAFEGGFGCERCWPPEAEAAWEARRALTWERDLVDESHYHVMILACSRCSQRFVSVFTETIDWTEGDDPQYWTLLPLTEAEAAELTRGEGSPTEAALDALGRGRRSLRRDRPKGDAVRMSWGFGICVGFHD